MIIKSKTLNLLISQLINLGFFKLMIDLETINDKKPLFCLVERNPKLGRESKVYCTNIENGQIRPTMQRIGLNRYY